MSGTNRSFMGNKLTGMDMTPDAILRFLSADSYAVAGASRDRSKYGNRVLRALVASGKHVTPINPNADDVEGINCVASILDIIPAPQSLSIVTPPAISLQVVEQAILAGVKTIWFQPGAENDLASELARAADIAVIDDGSCLLVSLRIRHQSD